MSGLHRKFHIRVNLMCKREERPTSKVLILKWMNSEGNDGKEDIEFQELTLRVPIWSQLSASWQRIVVQGRTFIGN